MSQAYPMNGEDSALKPTSHQAEEDQRLAERERRLLSCEERLKMQEATGCESYLEHPLKG